jgi:predicted nucleotidyltransferase
MNDLRWPPLAPPFDRALRAAVAFVVERFAPVGVVATGTIVRGNPSPSSDVDLYVVHRDPRRQRLQRRFDGVPFEIFVNPPERVLAYFAEERAEARPVTAHMLATGFVVLATDPVVDQLRARAATELADPPPADERELRDRRYMIATQIDDGEDVADADPATAALFFNQAVEGALRLRFRRAGLWLPRQKELLAALAGLDRPLTAAADAFLRAPDPAERRGQARRVVELAGAERGFFEWERELA